MQSTRYVGASSAQPRTVTSGGYVSGGYTSSRVVGGTVGATVGTAVGAPIQSNRIVSGTARPVTYGSRPVAATSMAARPLSGNVVSSGYSAAPVIRSGNLSTVGTSVPVIRTNVAPALSSSNPLFQSRPARVVQAADVYKADRAPVRVQPSQQSREPSIFDNVPVAAPDAILSLATRFKEDSNPNKVNLGIGAYRSEDGKPWPLPSVMQAQLLVAQDPSEDKEYVPIDGKPEHKAPVQALMFSDEEIASGRIATTQAISGTGALNIIGQFLSTQLNVKTIHVPDPTWGNHNAIFKRANLDVKKYTYYHPATRGFDFEGMLQAIDGMKAGEAILLHACAQNPTGVDPTPEQWTEIVNLVAQRQLVPVLDNAYQGYASGDLRKDGLALQLFEMAGLEYFVAQSFAKNFGLYGERIGYIHVRCLNADYAKSVLSQLKILIRQAYSSPPRHGAAVVHKVLTIPELKDQWLAELEFMSNRILQMRDLLRQCIEARGTPGTWNHITDQIGMFSFTGLTEKQVSRMVDEFSIYMTKDGRISVAGLNPGNVDYVAQCIDIVVRES